MKNLDHLHKIMLTIGFVAILSSCSKKLDMKPLEDFDAKTFWTSETNAMLALTGLYRGNISANNPNANPTDWWSYPGLLFMEFSTDNAYDRRGENSVFNKLSNGTLTADNAVLGQYWSQSYARIARCNDFLENIDKVPMEADKLKRLKAEARFLRACQYFYMSQFWGSVPLVTKTLSKEEANSVSKAPKADIINFVKTEFSEAAADMPRFKDLAPGERFRANKQAALAFLGRILLADSKYPEAAEVYKTIIDLNDNIIDPDYATIFILSNEASTENIFSVSFVENIDANAMYQHDWPAMVGGWHIFCPLGSIMESYDFTNGTSFSYTSPLYDRNDIYKNRDPRLKLNLLFNGDTFKGYKYITHPDSSKSPDQLGAGKQTTQTGYGVRKYLDPGFSGNLGNYGGNIPLIRYAEVLLSYLEAKLEAGQPIDQALLDATINKVRSRATVMMPAITETDPAKLRPILRKERRNELAFEGIRYWDLLRWRAAETVLKGDFYGAPFYNTVKPLRKKGTVTDPFSRWFVTSKNFRTQDYVWPIPQSEVNINPKLGQ